MLAAYDSVVVRTTCKVMIPFIQVFGLYVVFHGHESPGGGFQGGAILGASIILTRLTAGPSLNVRYLPGSWALRVGAVGVLIYLGVGLLSLLWGGNFLDYGRIPLPGISVAETRALGIGAVELAVAVAVTGVMVSIFDDLAPRPDAAESRATGRREGR